MMDSVNTVMILLKYRDGLNWAVELLGYQEEHLVPIVRADVFHVGNEFFFLLGNACSFFSENL
jgi:hypothetical protein